MKKISQTEECIRVSIIVLSLIITFVGKIESLFGKPLYLVIQVNHPSTIVKQEPLKLVEYCEAILRLLGGELGQEVAHATLHPKGSAHAPNFNSPKGSFSVKITSREEHYP